MNGTVVNPTTKPTEEDRLAFKRRMARLHPEEVPPGFLNDAKPQAEGTPSISAAAKTLFGEPREIVLPRCATRVRVNRPKVRHIQAFLAAIPQPKSGATPQVADSLGAFKDFLLANLAFPDGDTPSNLLDWLDDLDLEDGIALAEAVAEVVNVTELVAAVNRIAGKVRGAAG